VCIMARMGGWIGCMGLMGVRGGRRSRHCLKLEGFLRRGLALGAKGLIRGCEDRGREEQYL
jgi:hypothetical protein